MAAKDASPSARFSAGSTRDRTRLRANAWESFVGSRRGRSRRAERKLATWLLEVSSIGRTTRPRRERMPRAPRSPAPRPSRRIRVSTWSSSVWAVAMASYPTRSAKASSAPYRARRAAASTPPVPWTCTRRQSHRTPRRRQSRATYRASAAEPGRSWWSTVPTPRSRSSSDARSLRANRSATESGPPETATSTRLPRSPRRTAPLRTESTRPSGSRLCRLPVIGSPPDVEGRLS